MADCLVSHYFCGTPDRDTIPLPVVRIPEEYFARRAKQGKIWADHHPAVQWILIIGKNSIRNAVLQDHR